jgi:hypothetical protein
MDLHKIKEHLQNHLSDGLVIIVGSGLSCAEGIPGMADLASELKEGIPALIEESDKTFWDAVVTLLNDGKNLEEALLEIKISEGLEKVIIRITHKFISHHEKIILDDVFNNERILRFSTLLPYLLKPNSGINVITTNYDRLIEVACERANIAVNNSFSGGYVGIFSPKESKYQLCRGITQKAKRVFLKYAEHVSLYKPHGSLDWYLVQGEPVCSTLFSGNEKLIITPGVNKFRGGYERPFDSHRESANRSVNSGSRFLIIGYGFNDDHLQIHLNSQLEKGKQAVVLTHSISQEFRKYIEDKNNIWVVCSRIGKEGFQLIIGENEYEFDDLNIWDLRIFVNEVLE